MIPLNNVSSRVLIIFFRDICTTESLPWDGLVFPSCAAPWAVVAVAGIAAEAVPVALVVLSSAVTYEIKVTH